MKPWNSQPTRKAFTAQFPSLSFASPHKLACFSLKKTRKKTHKRRHERKRAPVKSRQWILQKKETMRKQGKKTAGDSKFTARKRGPRF